MSAHLEDEREAKRRALKEGEWACLDAKCAKVNDESRTYCEECGTVKPRATNRVGKEIGKEQADKSKGLFAAEDWVCSKCGNVNWARRKTCNVCNAPKLADLERRTGYGGGYMDRQDVEYVKRDFNEEFDEFGRIKKRKGEDQRDGSDESGNEGPRTAEEEDEENEDEEDEEGLGKYDFNFDSDPELAQKAEILKTKIITNNGNEDKGSVCDDSECSCSCSGGECSCPESEDEKEKEREKVRKSAKQRDRERGERRRSGSVSGDRDRDRNRKDRRRSRSRDKYGRGEDRRDRRRSRSRDRKRSRSPRGSNDRRRDDERRRENKRRSRSRDRHRR